MLQRLAKWIQHGQSRQLIQNLPTLAGVGPQGALSAASAGMSPRPDSSHFPHYQGELQVALGKPLIFSPTCLSPSLAQGNRVGTWSKSLHLLLKTCVHHPPPAPFPLPPFFL